MTAKEKINILYQKRREELKKREKQLINLARLNRKTSPISWTKENFEELNEEDIELLVELKNNADLLISSARSLIFHEESSAVKFQLLRDLCEENGLLAEYCNIAANGVRNMGDHPTYAQQMEILKYKLEKAEQSNTEWRETIENALGLEPDPVNHDKQWAYDIILTVREIGNRK
jgi:hypothetical protein